MKDRRLEKRSGWNPAWASLWVIFLIFGEEIWLLGARIGCICFFFIYNDWFWVVVLFLFLFFFLHLLRRRKPRQPLLALMIWSYLREAGMGYSKLGTEAQQEYHSPSLSPGCHLVWAAPEL